MELIRPMLAAPTKDDDLKKVTFPKLISAKVDGVRALCRRNPQTGEPELVSRKLLLIPNRHVQYLFAREEFVGLDGELCVGPLTAKNLYTATASGVMSEEGEPDVTWQVFDKWDMDAPYAKRAQEAKRTITYFGIEQTHWLSHILVDSYEVMMEAEELFVSHGYEGAMIRCPKAPYKQGRSTVKQQWLLKIKRFADGEAEVLGYAEQMRNDNEATTDETGYTKRSTHQAGKSAAGILGALRVRDTKTGVEFDVGTGFTHEQRRNLWEGRTYLVGKLIKYKHFPIGVKDKPRFPTFVGFRDRRDT